MEHKINEVMLWYNREMFKLDHMVKRNLHTISISSRLSWNHKRVLSTRILNWFRVRNLQLTKIRDTRITDIRNTYIDTTQKNKKAVLVGINYEGTSSELKGCVNDVYDLKDILISKYEYKEENIQLLLNHNATRKNILESYTSLLQSAKAGDHICFTFSGHGYYTLDMYEKDEVDGYDELIVSADLQYIVDDEFKALIQANLKPGVTLFSLFDNCHSGTMYDLRYQYFDSSNQSKETVTIHPSPNVLDTPGQVIMLSGCMDNQVSLDARINGKFNGVMTWCFLEALRRSNYEDSWESLLQRIRTILNVNKLRQIPQMSSGVVLDIKQKVFI